MKKFLAAFTAIIMALSLVTVPAAIPAEEPGLFAETNYNYTFDSDLQGWTSKDKTANNDVWECKNARAQVKTNCNGGWPLPNVWLTSPEINLPGAMTLAFDYLDLSASYGQDDRLDAYIIIGGEEILLQTFENLMNADGDMNHAEIDISDKATAEPFRIAFRYYTKNNPDNFKGVAVDNVEITGGGEIPTEEPPTEEPPTAEPPTEQPTDQPTELPTAEPEPQEGDVIFDIRNPETEDGLYYAQPGETVAVEFTVTGEYAAHGVNIWLNYDPEMLTVDHTEKGPVLTENAAEIGATVILNSDTVPGSIRLGIVCPDAPLTQEGLVYTVYFTIGEAVPVDTVIPLTVEVKEFVNMPIGEPAADIPFFVYNSSIVAGEEPVPPTEPPTEEPPTEEPPTEEPPTEEPPTEEPPTEEPTEPPAPPVTGFISLAGIGIASILAGAGVVLFRKKRS